MSSLEEVSTSERSDAELVEAWRAGERRACQELFDRHHARVVRFFRSKCPGETHDLSQRTFMTCFQTIEQLRAPGRFSSYLLGVAYNTLREHLRSIRRDRLDFETISVAALDPSPSAILARRLEHRVLLEAMRRVPLDYQVILELHYWEELPAYEIGEVLSLPLGTVKTRLRRARSLVHGEFGRVRAQTGLAPATEDAFERWAVQLRDELC